MVEGTVGDGFDDEVVLEENLEEKEDVELGFESMDVEIGDAGGEATVEKSASAVVQDAAVVKNPIAGNQLGDIDDEMDVDLEEGSVVADMPMDVGVNAGLAFSNVEEIE
ncbi:hypothetical protein HDU98_000769 [Podochytrium sp. JEL0797]|nr:hypothetical protein HDU98_000769 [Podochytrium sp. JEL0797]